MKVDVEAPRRQAGRFLYQGDVMHGIMARVMYWRISVFASEQSQLGEPRERIEEDEQTEGCRAPRGLGVPPRNPFFPDA